jgi:hypothetical protein
MALWSSKGSFAETLQIRLAYQNYHVRGPRFSDGAEAAQIQVRKLAEFLENPVRGWCKRRPDMSHALHGQPDHRCRQRYEFVRLRRPVRFQGCPRKPDAEAVVEISRSRLRRHLLFFSERIDPSDVLNSPRRSHIYRHFPAYTAAAHS